MSQQIDNQIVKMQFDNASFEKNVKESMSTIDKLKAALRFEDSSKSLDPLEKRLNSFNMDKLSEACDAVTKKFSFLGTVADQIMRDITTKVAQTAEKMVKSFTVDQVSSGWEKYADKTTAVQTIMANTVKDVGEGLKWKDQAEQMAAVTEQIEKLNWFTDETSYSLTDMTNNIGKFVAQSVELEKATDAMMGISTWAAISGQNKTQAQMAMYNLSQSLGANAVKAIDWKSIENANMATAEFKQTVIDTAKELGVLDEKTGAINKQFISAAKYSGPATVSVENFRDTLSSGWFNSDVLMQSLEKYGGFANKINELYNTINRNGMVSTTSNLLKVIDEVGSGSADASKHIETLAKNSGMAAEDLKTLFEELNKPEYDLGKRAFAAAQEAKTFAEAIDATSDAVASEWMGIFEAIFGNYLEAKELWTDLANSLWDIFAGPLDNIKWGLYEWKDAEISVFDDTEKRWTTMSGRELLLDAVATALNNIGEAIGIIHSALAEVFPIFRVFVTEGENAFDTSEAASGLVEFTKGLKAFADSLKLSEDAANSLHAIVHVLAIGMKTAFDVVKGFFEGIFKLIGPIFNIADAVFGLIGKIITALTGSSGVTAAADKLSAGAGKIKSVYLVIMEKVAWVLNKIADAIRGIPDSGIFRKIGKGIRYMRDKLIEFWDAFVNMPIVQQVIQDFWNTIDAIGRAITPIIDKIKKAFTDMGNAVKSKLNLETLNNVLTFLYNKLKAVINAIKDFVLRIKDFVAGVKNGKSIVESFKDSFGDIIEKLLELKEHVTDFFANLKEKLSDAGIMGVLDTVAEGIHNFVANITPEQVTMLAIAGAFMLITLNMLRLSEALTDALTAFSGIGKSIKNVINSYVKKQKSVVMQIAESIVMVAGALWVLSTIPKDKLEGAIGALTVLGGVIAVLLVLLTAAGAVIGKMGNGQTLVGLAAGLVIMTSSLMVAALSLKVLETVNLDGIIGKIAALAAIMLGLAGLAFLMRGLDKFNKGALNIVTLAGSLFLASLALAKIGELPKENLNGAVGALYAVMAGLALISIVAGKVSVFSSLGLIAVVMMLNKILPMIENLVNYDYTNIQAGIEKNKEILSKFSGMIILIAAVGALAGNRMKGVGIAMLSVAAAMAIFVGVAKLVNLLDPTELQRGEDFIFKMSAIIALLQLCSRRIGDQKNPYKGLAKIPVVMGLLLGVAKLASMMKPEELVQGELALLGLSAIIAVMLVVSRLAVKSEGIVKSVAGMIFAISLILGEVALLSMIPMESMVPALAAVLSIVLALGLLSAALSANNKIFNKNDMKASGFGQMIVALVMVAILGSVLITLSNFNMGQVMTAAGCLVATLLAAIMVINQLGKIKDPGNTKSQIVSIIGAIVMAGLIAMIVAHMAKQISSNGTDAKTLIASAASIALVMAALYPALTAMSKFAGNEKYNYGAMAEAVGLAIGALVSVATAIGLLSRFGGDAASMLSSAVSLGIGLVAICVPIAVLGFVGKLCRDVDSSSLVGPVVGAIAAVTAVGAAIGLLSNYGGDKMIESAKALAIGMVAISVPIAVLAALGKLCQGANLKSMMSVVGSAIVAMIGVAAVLGVFAKLMNPAEIASIVQVVPSLSIAMLSFSELCAVVAGIAAVLGPAGGAGVGAALKVIGVALLAFLGLVATLSLVGAALNEWTWLKDGIITGCDVLVLVFEKIGEAVGALVHGVLAGLAGGLDPLGKSLVSFSEDAATMGNNMTEIDPKVVDSCRTLAEALLILGGAELLDAITDLMDWIPGVDKDDMNFGKLGEGVAEFADSVKDLTPDMVTKAAICAQIAASLGDIQGALGTKGGIAGFIFGDKETLEDFGESLVAFAEGLVAFCVAIQVVPDGATEMAKKAAEATMPMLELTSHLNESGGLIQGLMGEKDLGDFGTKLVAFAGGLVAFIATIVTLELTASNYPELIRKCADATKPLIDLANGLQNMGGVLANIIGDNTLDRFGDTLPPFAKDFKKFVKRLAEIKDANPNYNNDIANVTLATSKLIELSNGLKNMGGALTWVTGDNTLDRFGEVLADYGSYLDDFYSYTDNIDPAKIDTMIAITNNLIDAGLKSVGVSADAFSGLRQAINDLDIMFGSTTDIDATKYNDLGISVINGIIAGMQTSTEETLKPYLKIFVTDYISNFRTEFAIDKFTIYGRNVIQGIKDGMFAVESTLFSRIQYVANSIKTKLGEEMRQDKFEVYGKYVVYGLRDGIEKYADTAINEAKELAEEINRITANTLQEKSPSRIAYKYGMFYDVGLANGISDYSSTAIEATQEMAEDVVEGANSIISAIRQAMNENVDTEPVIRPVLDTSDITRKAATIGRLFSAEDLQLAYNASSAAKQAAASKAEEAYTKSGSNEVVAGNQINFTQNNYSPKELSRMDIYRQTKNQLNMMKGVVKAYG